MNDQIFDVLKSFDPMKGFDAFKGQSANLMGPSREFNRLAISKLEQLTALQLASLREYTDLNLGQLKAAAAIGGAEDLQAYLAKQQDFLKTMVEKVASDAQAMAAIAKEFTEEAQKISRQG